MPFRRRNPYDERLFAYRSGFRRPDEFERQAPMSGQRERNLGWARRRDIDDVYSQDAAPQRGGRYDPTGEEEYAHGLEDFEAGRTHRQQGRYESSPPWELDEGGVQFGRRAQSGPHRGRGPRSYQRSDDRIRDDVCDWLTEAADVDASDIEVQVTAGVVTLSGAVENRYAKRRAEDLAESVSGVREVQNNLRLRSSSGDAPRDRSQEHSGR